MTLKPGYFRESAPHFRGVARLRPGLRKLTDGQVREILDWNRKGVMHHELARHYRVKPQTIKAIVRGKTHKKVFMRWCFGVAELETSQEEARS